MVFRTSSSQQEGGEREFALMTTKIEGKDGRIVALHAVEVELTAQGFEPVPGTEVRHECDLLLLALGFTGVVAPALQAELGVRLDERGNVAVDRHFRTNVEGVYAAGDARRGANLIVSAISDGREAARAIDASLRGSTSRLPTKGIEQSFDMGRIQAPSATESESKQ